MTWNTGPATIDEFRTLGIDHMVRQIEAANALGVVDVRGIAPSMPNFDFEAQVRQRIGGRHLVIVESNGSYRLA